MTNMLCNINKMINVQQVVNRFVWGHKPSKVKHSSMINDYKDGGLKMINVRSINMTLTIL